MGGGGIVVVASSNSIIYTEIRLALKKYVSEEYIIDLFNRHPLCLNNKDARIASLAMVSKEIYRKEIQGSVAEAGVYKGGFAKYINQFFPDRKLYLFDSFGGFDEGQLVKSKDNLKQTEKWINRLKDTSIDIVMSVMRYPKNVECRKGYIPNTLEGIEDKFAFVSLDMDIYKPTYEALNFFWEHLSDGGYIFVHDFDFWDGIDEAVLNFCCENKVGYFCLPDGMSVVISKCPKANG